MSFLDEFKWGGCLADDMGLGKTIQVLTFLQSQINRKPKQTNLVVAPTTLVFNWLREIEKFCPEMEVYLHQGLDRKRDKKVFKKHSLVLTSYGIMSNDIEFLSDFQFNYVVLDESQAIKNPAAKRYKAACLLKAKNRIVLTGTPIENNTFDLYAQMNFLNRGILGSVQLFKEQFSNPIDKEGDEIKIELLKKMVYPFILRRTKELVAKELPPKTEDILYCELDKGQRKVYEAFKTEYRKKVLGKIEESGLAKSGIYVLEGMLKLRQICDSPAILSNEEDYGNESVKIEELVRHIEEKTGQHKILVFSQFVTMLQLIKQELDSREINYEYLDGSTRDRQACVDRFQTDDKCRVFLISLKAGGVGLNLTEADYVFLVDPWWNPQVEVQAIDRTHRIGQTKKVFAYKMICKDTIEEKVLKLQEKKKSIAKDLISSEKSFVKNLTKADIEDLFS